MHTLAKEFVQFFLMMWLVLGMRAGLWTVDTQLLLTVFMVKMQVSVAKLNVSDTMFVIVDSINLDTEKLILMFIHITIIIILILRMIQFNVKNSISGIYHDCNAM